MKMHFLCQRDTKWQFAINDHLVTKIKFVKINVSSPKNKANATVMFLQIYHTWYTGETQTQ